MLVRLSCGPLAGLEREVPDGATQFEVPFVSGPRGSAEAGPHAVPDGYWIYTLNALKKWAFSGIRDRSPANQTRAMLNSDCFQVDEPGTYILDNGDVIELMRDHSGFYYGMFRGFLCTIKLIEERNAYRVVTINHLSSCGLIVDKGSWCPATFSDLNIAPVRARFYIGTNCVEGMLAGVRHTDKGWRWIASSGDEFEHCQVIKRLSELPF